MLCFREFCFAIYDDGLIEKVNMAFWQDTPGFGLSAQHCEVLTDAKQYHQTLLKLIAAAEERIYITALYLQDDEAGQQVLNALHAAARPADAPASSVGRADAGAALPRCYRRTPAARA